MKPWQDVISVNLKQWRKAYGWSQSELAENAGCSMSVVRDLEAKNAGASVDMLAKIAEALNVNLHTLFSDSGKPQGLLQPQINEISRDASTHTLLDALMAKIKAIPEGIIEIGYYYKPSRETWDEVEHLISSRSRKNSVSDEQLPLFPGKGLVSKISMLDEAQRNLIMRSVEELILENEKNKKAN